MTSQVELDKQRDILGGIKRVVSDAELDYIGGLDDYRIESLRSIPNPKRVGILDAYLAWCER